MPTILGKIPQEMTSYLFFYLPINPILPHQMSVEHRLEQINLVWPSY